MLTTGIVIDLKNIKEEHRKPFFILDKAVRSYSMGNNSPLNKLTLGDRYWTFVVNPTKDQLRLLYRSYGDFCKEYNTDITVYEYALLNEDFNYKNMGHPIYVATSEFKVNIHKLKITKKEQINYGIDVLDFQKDILNKDPNEEENIETVTLIVNDYARMDAIIKEFILEDYSKIRKERME